MSEPLTNEQLSTWKALAATLAYERGLYEMGETSFAIRWEDTAWDGQVEDAITALILEVERLRAMEERERL